MKVTADMIDSWREAIEDCERTGDVDYIAGIAQEMFEVWRDMIEEEQKNAAT